MKLLFEDAYNQYLKYIENRLKLQSKESIKYKFKDIILPFGAGDGILNLYYIFKST